MANESKASLIVELKDLVSQGISKIGEKIEDLGAKLEKSKFIWAGLFGGMVGAVGVSLKAFGEEERSVVSLTAALRNQGIISEDVISSLRQHASALQELTGIQDNEIIQSEAVLVKFGLTGEKLKEVTKLTLDFAKASGLDLPAAATLMGKAFIGETARLVQYGIVVDEKLSVTKKFDEVLRQVSISMGGRAQAEANTFAGSLEKLSAQFDNLLATIGGQFIPLLNSLSSEFKPTLKSLQDFVILHGEAIVKVTIFAAALTGLMTAAAGLAFLFSGLAAAFGSLLGPIGVVGIALAGFVTYLAGGSEAMEKFRISVLNDTDALENKIKEKTELVKQLEQEEADFKAQMEYQKTLGASLSYQIQEETAQASFDKQKQLDEARASLDAFNLKKKHAMEEKSRQEKLAAEQALNAKLLAEQQRANLIELQERQKHDAAKKAEIDLFNQYTILGFNALRAAAHNNVQALFYINKASAIAEALINTAVAYTRALREGGFFLGIPMANAIAALGAAQVGLIVGTTIAGFAQGGMVLPTAGGTIARIGEAGSPEAVIPLNDSEATKEIREALGGGSTTINVNAGVIVADDASMRELAKMIDEKLFELRRNRESVSF